MEFNGSGYFCSDVCEIRNYASHIMIRESVTITPENKEEQIRERLSKTSTPVDEIIENKENSIQVEIDLKTKIEPDKSNPEDVL